MKLRDLWHSTLPAAPDGGLGWLCVASGFGLYSLAVGLQYVFGIILSAILLDASLIGAASRAEVSWASSIQSAAFMFGALPSSLLRPTLGIRGTILLGGALLSLGSLFCAYASDLTMLCFGMSIVGLGCSLPSTVAVTALQAWFVSYRGTASGIVVCGSGAGAMLLGPLIQEQVDLGGWRRAMLCIALLSAVVIPLCALFTIPLTIVPLPPEEAAAGSSSPSTPSAGAAGAAASPLSPALTGSPSSHQLLDLTAHSPAPQQQAAAPEGRRERVFIDWPEPALELEVVRGSAALTSSQGYALLLANQPFLCFLGFISLYGSAWFSLIAHYNSAARETGTSADDAALLVTYQGLLNIAGRLSMGWLSDRLSARGISQLALLQVNVATMAAFTALLAVPSLLASPAYQVLYAAANGGFGGSLPSLQAPIVVDLVGLPLLPLAFGLVNSVQAPLVLVAPVLYGALRSATGNWVAVFGLVGLSVAAGVSILSLMQGLKPGVAPLTLVGLWAWGTTPSHAKPLP